MPFEYGTNLLMQHSSKKFLEIITEWVELCSTLDLSQGGYEVERSEVTRQMLVDYFNRPLEEIARRLKENNITAIRLEREREEQLERNRRHLKRLLEQQAFEKYKGTEWEKLFDGEWEEGDEEFVRKEKQKLEKLRERFIEAFGFSPEDETDMSKITIL